MSALPDTTRLLLATARALHPAGYRRPYAVNPGDPSEHYWKLDSAHYIVFESLPGVLKDQPRLTVRHGAQQIVWDGANDPRDAITLLVTLGVLGTCRQCDLPVEADAVECGSCAVTTDLIAYDRAVDAADHGRHAAHEAA